MSPRPYQTKKIDDLEKLFRERRKEPDVIDALWNELQHRSTQRAVDLRGKVAKALKTHKDRQLDIFRSTGEDGSQEDRPFLSKTGEDAILRPRPLLALDKSVRNTYRLPPGEQRELIQILSADSFKMLEISEQMRLKVVYEQLRIKLLDLTKRNRMLNYAVGSRSRRQLQIVDEVLEEVYRQLVEEESSLKLAHLDEPVGIPPDERTEEFVTTLEHAKISDVEHLVALEALISAGGETDAAYERLEHALRDRVRVKLGLPPRLKRTEINRNDHARSLGIDPNAELKAASSKKTHSDGALQTLKYPDELEAVLEKLTDEARLAEQEAGLSTLFLAFGFLEWYESDTSERPLYAPLLLLPVSVERETIRGKDVYRVSSREAAAESNISLQKFLEQDRDRVLPNFETIDSGDEAGAVEAYFAKVRTSVEGLKRWQVRRWLVLGHFAFSRIAIYEDTDPKRWPKEHPASDPLVGALLSGFEQDLATGELSFGAPEDYRIDDPEIEKAAPILIHDADASQHSAVVDVMKAKNLVIEGPPGTGKSQTITNIIANMLAAGKTVLFLAEKQAALDVVKRRLDAAGLGDFCLELHSEKASSKAVVRSLERRHKIGTGRVSKLSQPPNDLTRGFARTEIAEYLEALHREDEDGETPFRLIWQSVRGRSLNSDLSDMVRGINIPLSQLKDQARLNDIRGRLDIFASAAQNYVENYGHPSRSPWNRTPPRDLAAYDREPLLDALQHLQSSTRILLNFFEEYSRIGINSSSDADAIVSKRQLLGALPDPSTVASIALIDLNGLERALVLQESYLAAASELSRLPSLNHVDSAVLARASKLRNLPHSDSYSMLRPLEYYGLLESKIATRLRFIDLVDSIGSSLTTLGLDKKTPVDALDAVIWAVEFAAGMNSTQRAWAGEHQINPQSFAKLHMRRTALSSESRELANLLDMGSVRRLDPETLEAAAESLNKTGVGKLLDSFRGGGKTAHSIVEQLGIRVPPSAAASILLRLARHLRQQHDFNSSREGLATLGVHWKGMETPFTDIQFGVEVRDHINRELRLLPSGEQIAAAFIALSVDKLELLGRNTAITQKYKSMRSELNDVMTGNSLDAALERCLDEISRCEQQLDIDPDRTLSAIDNPIAELADLDMARNKLARTSAAVAASSFKVAIQSLAFDYKSLQQTKDAIHWTRTVRSMNIPDIMRSGLLSEQASEWMREFSEVASVYLPIRERCEAAQAAMSPFNIPEIYAFDLKSRVDHIEALLDHRSELGDFISVTSSRAELATMGLTEFLDRADAYQLSPRRLSAVFEAIVSRLRVNAARRASTSLSHRTGNDLEAKRKTFAERDRLKIINDRDYVRNRLLTSQPPNGTRQGSVKTWTEMSLLANEFPKQKRFTPVRALLGRAGNAISSLKPCFMMSPLSLAKFVPAGSLRFDALVIDEASQMRPEDALGAMLRADQIIVVGDPKQLPPTSFFDRANSDQSTDDGDQDDIDDESILERCQKVFKQVRRLKWHYRSRCESLIRFSNENFYENSLITFPAAKPNSFSIDLIRVDGAYQAKRNVAEAERVAEEAVAFMRHFGESETDSVPSLGIVALNTDQRDLIQETLRHVSTGDDLVQRYNKVVEARGEPVFVKNLENVQGDERDFIFISMTYGREPGATAMKQRFGPINSKQGHRRLNVLFSRARIRIGLFASFGSADVKPAETSNEGVRVLKRYLEYAEVKGRAPVEAIGGEADSDFEIEVAERLVQLGYSVDMQVGVSGYRIDLGVRHPERPEMFLVGIECDGAAYHSSKSARDRDRLREDVLRGLGWELLRVWSTDWFDDPDSQTERLAKKLDELRTRPISAYDDYALQAVYSDTDVAEPDEIELDEGAAVTAPVSSLTEHAPEMEEDGMLLLSGEGAMSETQAFRALVAMREHVIRPAASHWEAQRSILRDSMIETFVRQHLSDPENWFHKVPQYQRSGTDPMEKRLYLERICAVVDRIR